MTLVRGAIRGLLRALPAALAEAVRGRLGRDDDTTAGKPACDWDDPAAREALVDALVRDGPGAPGAVAGAALPEAAVLLATVLGQDVQQRAEAASRSPAGSPRTG